ncbi:MAG: hypothetical protein AAGF83_10685 [Cyanobacteria bacterium P01_G01_bin.67]
MAYYLMVGKSNKAKDNPIIVGSIEFDLYATITSLQKRFQLSILTQLCDLFDDYTFSNNELIQAKQGLYQVMVIKDLRENELAFVYKLIAIVCFAIDSGYPLYGVAD